MIVDSPLLVRLPLGTDRIIPETGDAQVHIPSEIVPAIIPTKEFTIQGSGATIRESALISVATQITNQAASGQNIAIFEKGLWEIDIVASIHTDYEYVEGNLGIPDFQLNLSDSIQGNFLLGMYASLKNTAQNQRTSTRFLANRQFILAVNWVAVALGAHLDWNVSLFANRIL